MPLPLYKTTSADTMSVLCSSRIEFIKYTYPRKGPRSTGRSVFRDNAWKYRQYIDQHQQCSTRQIKQFL